MLAPTYRDIVAARARVEAVPVPVDDRGINVDALEATGAGAVVVTPAHQAPTGVVMAPERRHALLAWAHRHDAVVIEDDYDSEFRYDREPIGTL
jgi:GntR family transcriptional regulator / MocR family aminotransferase